jgi:outer membrane protein assembly factor BamB
MASQSSFSLFRSPRRIAWLLVLLASAGLVLELALLRGDVARMLDLFGLFVWVTGALALIGVLAVIVGVGSLVRDISATGSEAPRWVSHLLLTAFGVGLGAFATTALVNHSTLFARDYVDPEGLARLKQASLAPTDKAATGDWPQWRGPNRDGISGETDLRTDWSNAPPPVVWKRPLGGGYSSIAVVDGRLYTQDKQGGEERVVCLDAATGKDVWTHSYAVEYTGFRMGYAQGPRATPTVFDGRVYTVGATGIFLCLEANPSSGRANVLWHHDLRKEFDAPLPTWGFAGSPWIEGDWVIVQPGGKQGSVAAFERRDGRLVWKALSDPAGYSSPIGATLDGVRHVLAFTGTALVGLRPENGHVLWSYPWTTRFEANIATPIVAGNYVFISSDYSAGCALVEVTADGAGGATKRPIYVKRNKLMRNHHDTCVLVAGHLYGFDEGVLKCVDLQAATEKWASRDLAKGSVLAGADHLFVLTEDGSLALLEASPEEYRQKGLMPNLLQGPECWALPALASGRLYLRGHHEIVCLDIRK